MRISQIYDLGNVDFKCCVIDKNYPDPQYQWVKNGFAEYHNFSDGYSFPSPNPEDIIQPTSYSRYCSKVAVFGRYNLNGGNFPVNEWFGFKVGTVEITERNSFVWVSCNQTDGNFWKYDLFIDCVVLVPTHN